MRISVVRYVLFVSVLAIANHALALKDTLIVVGDFDYPPYSFIATDGNVDGHDVDVMKALEPYLEVNSLTYDFQHWDSALNALQNRKVDVISGIVYSEERDKIFDFTIPLHTEYYALFCSNTIKVGDVNDLNGYTAIVLEGDIANDKFLMPMGFMDNVIYARSLPDALLKVEKGLGDFVVAPYPLGMEILERYSLKNVSVQGPPVLPAVYCLAVAEGDVELLSKLNKGIQQLNKSKELERIHKKWVKYKRHDDRYQELFSYSLWALLLAAIVIGNVLFLWLLMRKQLKHKKIEIKEIEGVYQNIFMSLTDAVIIFTLDGYVVDANAVALKLYGKAYDDFIGLYGKEFFSEKNYDLFDTHIGSAEPTEMIYIEAIEKVDGDKIIYLNMHSTIIYFKGKKHYMVMFRDVTKERESALKLHKAQEGAEGANRTKSAFLATMSHEIRTPLNAIIGFLKLLGETDLDIQQADYIKKIDLSSRLLLSLINDVLDMTKIEAGKLQLDLAPFQLKPLLNRLLDIQKVMAQDKGLGINLTIPSELADNFKGDSLRLFQVLLHLVNNAIKFTEEGEIEILVKGGEKYEENSHAYQRVWFTIKDTGIGIPEGKLSKLFMPFSQVDRTNTRKYGGSGLGLAISKHLVELMDGEMYVESKSNQGSIFSFFVNLQMLETKEVFEEKRVEREKDFTIEGVRVLLVEDNEFNAQIFQEQLINYGAQVVHSYTGEDALVAMEDNDFDIILMDIELPGIDGFETTTEIKKYSRWSTVPIVALSAHTLSEETEKALKLGMVAYLSKPLQIEELISTIIHYTKDKIRVATTKATTLLGLKNFGGDESMFLRALLRFKKVYSDTPELVKELLEKGEVSEMKTIAHNLKSGAGMIGAINLSIAAEQVDRHIKKTGEVDKDMVNVFLEELIEALNDIGNETTE